MTLGLSQSSDRSTHGLVGHPHKPHGHLLAGHERAGGVLPHQVQVDLLRQLLEGRHGRFFVKWLILIRTKYVGEVSEDVGLYHNLIN